MKRRFLTLFLDKISKFPDWVKEIIYHKLSGEIDVSDESYVFVNYRPILTFRGKSEIEYKDNNFDTNIYNMLTSALENLSICEIMCNTYLSMEEIAGYFLFCVNSGYFELPADNRVMNIANFIVGKYKIGEYFYNSGYISSSQLDSAINIYSQKNSNKKFGQIMIDSGMVSESQLCSILKLKQDSQKRFILDYNDVPQLQQHCVQEQFYDARIKQLEQENKILNSKLEQLLAMVREND